MTLRNVIERLEPTDSTACPICGPSAPDAVVHTQPRHLKFFGRGALIETALRIVMCTRCGLLRQNPRLSTAAILELYARTAHYEAGTPRTERPARRELAKMQIAFGSDGWGGSVAGAAVADIGCAGGVLLEQFRGRAASVIGVEPSAADCAHAEQRGITMVRGAWEEVEFPYHVDLMFACHVLEHTTTPLQFLEKVAGTLRPGGQVYLEVENLWEPRPQLASVFFIEHLFYFTPRTLAMILRRAGLQVLRMEESDTNPPGTGMDYSVVRCVAGHGASSGGSVDIGSDVQRIEAVLAKYTAAHERIRQHVLGRVRHAVGEWRRARRKYGIFGTGGHTQQLLALEPELLADPLLTAFLDNNESLDGSDIAGIPVRPPARIGAEAITGVLISSREFEDEIWTQLAPLEREGIEIVRLYA